MIKKLAILAGSIALASSSFASFTSVNNAAALGANDSIDWNQFGADSVHINSGATGVTANGIGFTLLSVDNFGVNDNGGFDLYHQGTTWNGSFANGEAVLYHELSGLNFNSYINIIFNTQVSGVGMTMSSNRFGDFNTTLFMYDVQFPGNSYQHAEFANGSSPLGGGGSLPFSGAYSDTDNVGAWDLNIQMSDGVTDDLGFGISNVLVRDHAAVPEPASMAALGMGIVALIRKRKNQK